MDVPEHNRGRHPRTGTPVRNPLVDGLTPPHQSVALTLVPNPMNEEDTQFVLHRRPPPSARHYPRRRPRRPVPSIATAIRPTRPASPALYLARSPFGACPIFGITDH